MAKVDGVQVIQDNGKRVRVLFTPEAREAVEKTKHVDYVERVAASDNLREMLGTTAPAQEQALGRSSGGTTPAAAPAGAE